MRKYLTLALVVGLLLPVGAMTTSAQAAPSWKTRWETARFRTLQWPEDSFSLHENVLTIKAAFRAIAPTQVSTALRVAECESGLNEYASNGGMYVGLFQHHAPSWQGRVDAFTGASGPLAVRRPTPKWSNPRVQAIVSARMVRADGGWGQWSCY